LPRSSGWDVAVKPDVFEFVLVMDLLVAKKAYGNKKSLEFET